MYLDIYILFPTRYLQDIAPAMSSVSIDDPGLRVEFKCLKQSQCHCIANGWGHLNV